ncbi:MAG: hypothetical protein FD176_2348 [Rhodospirillaceae bacterium]|nr:MAG: hypothetical protein FD176_2348 [Rhodospirillaceae bacterium]TNC97116.1 MAG: Secreted protein [Stygiobacter sp.]
MRYLIPMLAVLAAASPAVAAPCQGPQGLPSPGAPLPLVEGQFRYSTEHGLGCTVSSQQGAAMAKHESPVTFLPCLRIGAIGISDSLDQVEKLLGPPVDITDMGVFSESRIYEVAQRGALRPHYVVTYYDSRVVAVQLIGPPMVIPAKFSGLVLGDDQQKIIDTLGWPEKRCQAKGGGIEMWTWANFPIAIDVIDGFAAGFKVTWAAGR